MFGRNNHRIATGQVIGLHASPRTLLRVKRSHILYDHWSGLGVWRRDAHPRYSNLEWVPRCSLALVAGGCGTMEHPRGVGPRLGRFRIWDSALVRRLLRSPAGRLFTFNQGLLGQVSVKPTTFLCIRLYREIRQFVLAGSTYYVGWFVRRWYRLAYLERQSLPSSPL